MGSSCVKTPPTVTVVDAPRPRVDGRLKRPCPAPVAVPAGRQTRKQVQSRWNLDRQNLRTCRARHGELARQISDIEAAQ
ncbi:MAG: hypothetical protein AAF903_12080 [Pseudomonadota bacterium]